MELPFETLWKRNLAAFLLNEEEFTGVAFFFIHIFLPQNFVSGRWTDQLICSLCPVKVIHMTITTFFIYIKWWNHHCKHSRFPPSLQLWCLTSLDVWFSCMLLLLKCLKKETYGNIYLGAGCWWWLRFCGISLPSTSRGKPWTQMFYHLKINQMMINPWLS
mgnify:CR=1 FL=1